MKKEIKIFYLQKCRKTPEKHLPSSTTTRERCLTSRICTLHAPPTRVAPVHAAKSDPLSRREQQKHKCNQEFGSWETAQ